MVSTKLRRFSPVASAMSSLMEPRTLATESLELRSHSGEVDVGYVEKMTIEVERDGVR
jgi:hypothetical protein